jgi:hypothetical protein
MMPSPRSLTESFWAKVKKTDSCWLWIGSRQKNDYGRIKRHRKILIAHRVSWFIHNGPIPDGLLVCHHCDNPMCVNPNHLFLGTQQDNFWDMYNKGRKANCQLQNNGRAKLDNEKVTQIKLALSKGVADSDLALIYGVSECTIRDICYGRSWVGILLPHDHGKYGDGLRMGVTEALEIARKRNEKYKINPDYDGSKSMMPYLEGGT